MSMTKTRFFAMALFLMVATLSVGCMDNGEENIGSAEQAICLESLCHEASACGMEMCVNNQCVVVPSPPGTECRSAAGSCDVAESCDGSNTSCPADVNTCDVSNRFDWGTSCQGGGETFSQAIPYKAAVDVGTIPAGLSNVFIQLTIDVDVDIQLIDKVTGQKIIDWQGGLLAGAGEACATYQGVEYCYSGYNGVAGELGREWVRINNPTNRELTVRAFGFEAGTANFEYSWTADPGCVQTGSDSFTQHVARRATAVVGDIPAGDVNIRINLTATQDVDIQLIDKDAGTKLVAWPGGLIDSPGLTTITYKNMEITYGGYNGTGGSRGNEFITIKGTVSTTLTLAALGYAAGDVQVDYAWGLADSEL